MTPAQDKPAHLSVHRAFVVHFRPDPAVEQGNLAGGVEHVVTGQAADFQSLETLLAFITITLKPGMIVHVPVGVAHGITAEGRELTWVDFAQPLSIRTRWSGSSNRCPHAIWRESL